MAAVCYGRITPLFTVRPLQTVLERRLKKKKKLGCVGTKTGGAKRFNHFYASIVEKTTARHLRVTSMRVFTRQKSVEFLLRLTAPRRAQRVQPSDQELDLSSGWESNLIDGELEFPVFSEGNR